MNYREIIENERREKENLNILNTLKNMFNKKELENIVKTIEDENLQFDNIIIVNDIKEFSSYVTDSIYETYNYLNNRNVGVCERFENIPKKIIFGDELQFGKKIENEEDGICHLDEPNFDINKKYIVYVETEDECTAIVNPEQNNFHDFQKLLIVFKK
jgi:hypothetical protein